MMSSHLCESGIRPDTADGSIEAGLVGATVAVPVAALVAATGQRTTPTAI